MRKLIVIGTSAGGLHALQQLLGALPADLQAAVLIVMHIGANPSELPGILSQRSALPVLHARDQQLVEPCTVLIAPPDHHLLVDRDDGLARVTLSRGPKENHTRPAIDPLFRSAAAAFGPRVIGVLLTGYLDDGTVGLQAIKACTGMALVQDPADAFAPDMPASALQNVAVDYSLPLHAIAPALISLVDRPVKEAPPAAPHWVQVENRFARNQAGIDDLPGVGTPSTFTCPDCGGTLWQLAHNMPRRFRCHTGHSYTIHTLLALQQETVEHCVWAAIRALQEQERLAEDMRLPSGEADPHYAAAAQRARERAARLRAVLEEEP